MALLSFLGAIQQVTGSCYLIETHDGARVLLECGMHQGRREEAGSDRSTFAFDPKTLDAWVLSHAHIDHSGLLPRLVALGYRETFDVAPGVAVTFHDAGHILGSSIVQLDVHDHGRTRRVVFSGDLGNDCSPLMHAPTVLKEADVVLMESTYGDRDHRSHEDTIEELAGILQQAHRDGGNVLMPSFAVGRTQDLIYYLGRFYREGRLPQQAVFLDSPMAIGANAIYSHYKDQLDLDGIDNALSGASGKLYAERWLPILRSTPTPEESMAINRFKSGVIIIAGSGMCTGGRILHHFKHNLWREECHLVIPGFQARGTLGRAIVDGAKSVKLLHQRIAVNAKVHTLGGFSAHAGQSQLIDWVSNFESRPELYLVHGELEKMQALQQTIRERLDWEARIPEPGDRIAI